VAPHLFTVGNLQLRDDETEWKAVAGMLDVAPSRLFLIRQVHGASVAVRRSKDTSDWPTPEADIIVSDDPSAAVAVRVADCAPILIADAATGVVGAVHAGWRGTVQYAAPAGVRAMAREFGSRPSDLVAAVGPCLGPCCGEVGEEVVAAFRDAGHSESALARWFSAGPRGRPMFGLWQANLDQLIDAGVPREHVYVAELCTKTHAPFMHSYRASGAAAGRMAGAIRSRQSSVVGRQPVSR
jgi:YfiH family protein